MEFVYNTRLLETCRGVQPAALMAVNVAQHKIINLLKTLRFFF